MNKIWSLITIMLALIIVPAASAVTVNTEHIDEIMRGNIIDIQIQIAPENQLLPLTGIEIQLNDNTCGIDLNANTTCEYLTITEITEPTTNSGERIVTGTNINGTNQTHTFTNGTGINNTITVNLNLDTELLEDEITIQAAALLEDETTTARIYSEQTTLTITPEPLIAHLRVHENYPRDGEVVVICESNHATTFDWDFGDGEKFYDIQNNNVFHRYEKDGTYTITCGATNVNETIFSSTQVTITDTPQLELDVDVNGQSAKITCTPTNFDSDRIDFDFGQKTYWDVDSQSFTHTYTESGSYIVSCSAQEGNINKIEYTQIEVEVPQPTPQVQEQESSERWADGSFQIINQQAQTQTSKEQPQEKQVVLRPSSQVEDKQNTVQPQASQERTNHFGASLGGAAVNEPISPLLTLLMIAGVITIVLSVSIIRGSSDEFFGLR